VADAVLGQEEGLPALSTTLRQFPSREWVRPDGRRILQLVLATVWLLDGILQLQAFFFTKSFGLQMISGMSSGNPSIIGRPISWSGAIIGHHAALTDAAFAAVQCGLGFAIAWRPTVKVGLGASIVWALGVWWIGEALGGILNGTANPINGAPGAVILYAILAVLLWPSDRKKSAAPFIAARAVGVEVARGIWLLLWASLAYVGLLGTNRSSQGLHDWIGSEANGEPGWLGWIDHRMANVTDHRGLAIALVSSAIFGVVGVSTYLPRPLANGFVVLALVIGALIWLVGENLGEIFTNGATDVNSGPLLILLAVAYWRPGRSRASAHDPVLGLPQRALEA
jgi:hypothetical protein